MTIHVTQRSLTKGRAAVRAGMLASLGLTMALTAWTPASAIKSYFEFKNPTPTIRDPSDISNDTNNAQAPVLSSGPIAIGFEGVSQYDGATLGRNFLPPDTMGAVGATQYMEFVNGATAVFDKATGTRTSLVSDTAFWAAAGQTGANGDSRVMYSASMNRWIALAFGASVSDIQIAVSDTSNALGGWKSTKFTGYSGLGFGGTADYPTLAMDTNAVYIATNNFAPATAGGTNSFRGTTLDIIPLASLFNATTPTTAGLKQFVTPFTGGAGDDFSRGFAIQGVNSNEVTSTGNIVTVDINDFAINRYDVLNAGTAGATLTASIKLGSTYAPTAPGRQPSGLRIVDTLDDRISSSAYEVNGRIYTVQTVTEPGSTFTSVRYYVLDSVTNQVLDQGDIGGTGFDYYQGSLAVNSLGQVVIGYNRSGFSTDGKIKVMARTFVTGANGKLMEVGQELLLKDSLTDRYLNGAAESGTPAGRQRWGDYSAVSLDPVDNNLFWVIGEFAREANTLENGHPGGSGFSRWGTYIAAVNFSQAAAPAVPEPAIWLQMIAGFGLLGGAIRRARFGGARSVTA